MSGRLQRNRVTATPTVIYDANQRTVIGVVRATNLSDEDHTFGLAVTEVSAQELQPEDWQRRAAPILAGESVDAMRAVVLGAGQKPVAVASSPSVVFSLTRLERGS